MTKFQINPVAMMVVMFLGGLVVVVGQGTLGFPPGVSPDAQAFIIGWAKWLTALWVLVVAPILTQFSSSLPGLLAPKDPPVVQDAMKKAGVAAIATVALLAGLSIAPRAYAAQDLPIIARQGDSMYEGYHPAPKAIAPSGTATTVPCTDLINLLPLGCTPASGTPSPLSGPIQDFINFFSSDFSDAANLAVAIPGLQDGNGQACWIKAGSVSALMKAHPLPVTFKVATDFEALRLLNMSINNLCADPHCTQVFTDLSNGVSQLGMNISVPSLTGLCTRFPTIVQVPAVSPLAAPSAAPATPTGN